MNAAAPLAGCRVLVTRPADGAELLLHRLQALGATAVLAPTIEIHPPADAEALQGVLAGLPSQAWVVLTSPTAARLWLQLSTGTSTLSLAAVGQATARILEAGGQSVALVSERATGVDLAETLLARTQATTFVLPRSDRALPELPVRLRNAGRTVIEVELYRTVARSWTETERSAVAAGVDAVLLMSPSAAEGLLHQGDLTEALATARFVAMGPTTAAACQRLLGRVDAQADPPSLEGMLAALVALAERP